MNLSRTVSYLFGVAVLAAASSHAHAAGASFDAEISALREDWASAVYRTPDKHERGAALQSVLDRAAKLRAENPTRVEAVAWEGIIMSGYAGEVSAFSAMKWAKAARDALRRAEAMDPAALDGGIYVSLGALYSKVPGGIMGFGNDMLAADYFVKALKVDPDGLDNNYFYGEFLVEHGEYAKASALLAHALEAPPIEDRPIFDAGRRAEIRALLEASQSKAH